MSPLVRTLYWPWLIVSLSELRQISDHVGPLRWIRETGEGNFGAGHVGLWRGKVLIERLRRPGRPAKSPGATMLAQYDFEAKGMSSTFCRAYDQLALQV
jgi:hypothetical protein